MTETTCPTCDAGFSSEKSVRDHSWDAHDACHRCGDRFDDRATLYTHWLAAHEDDLSRSTRKRAFSEVGAPTFTDRLSHQGPAGAIGGVSVSRRTILGGGAAGLVLAVGGVVANGVISGGGGPGGGGGGGGGGGVGTDSSLAGHPATGGLESQPTVGPAPSEADGTIVAFEDPSCPSCARFELGTFPTLESRLIDTGKLSFVYRGIPVVYPWGDPAVLALEATYARDQGAFWALKEFYYASQDRLDTQNVRDATRQFLGEQTAVDPAAVLADVEAGTHRDAVEADLRASRAAGVRGTPTFFLFRDGSYVTDIVGPQPYSVFANSLGM